MLYNKWWKDTGTCVRDEDKGSKANALGVENVGGIFVVLMAGLALAIIVAICEFVWRSRKNAREDKVGAPGLAVPENAREDKVGAPGLAVLENAREDKVGAPGLAVPEKHPGRQGRCSWSGVV